MKMNRLFKLEQLRKEKNLTREDLALMSGLSKATIEALERGRTNVDNIKLSTLIALATVLDVKVVDLLPKKLQNKIR